MNNFAIDVEKILIDKLTEEINDGILEVMEKMIYGYSPSKLKEQQLNRLKNRDDKLNKLFGDDL
jgi:spore coat protein CotF